MKYSGIGGQAVLEGVMMRNKDQYAVAVRKPDGNIVVKKEEYKGIAGKSRFFRLPFFRGIVNFIDSLVLGMSTLMYAASFYDDDDEEEDTRTPEQKKKSDTIFTVVTMLVSVVLAIGIFMVGPYFLSLLIGKYIKSESLIILIEGIIRVVILVAYMALISLMKDIKRVYMYHGAEHKCISCLENGLELTVENVKKSSKEHKRCGTSLLLLVMCISILVLMFVRFDSRVLRLLARIVLIPVIAGISYELLRFAGTHDNCVVNFFIKPGLALQKLTTKEPDDDMIEVGIASVNAVFDWRGYLEENFGVKCDKAEEESHEADDL